MVVEVFGKHQKIFTYFNIIKYFLKFSYQNKKIKKKFNLYFILILFFGFTELIIISGFPSLIAIVNSLNNSDGFTLDNFIANYVFLNINSIEIYLAVFFLNSFLKIYLIWYLSFLSANFVTNLQNSIYEKIFLINKISINTSEIRSILTNKIEFFYGSFIISFLFLFQALALLLACIFALNSLSRFNIFITLTILFIIYILIFIISKKSLKKNDVNIKNQTTSISDLVDIMLKDLRGLKANDEYHFYKKELYNSNDELRRSIALNYFLGNVPKNVIEITGFAIFFILVLSLSFIDSQIEYIILFGTLGLISIRLLPSIQRVYWALNNLYSTHKTWFNIIDCLRSLDFEEKNDNKTNQYNKVLLDKISLKNIDILNNNNEYIIRNFSYDFWKNRIYLIKGPSGSGKTSLIDVIMGLRNADKGQVIVNDNLTLPAYKTVRTFYISQENAIPNGNFIDWFNGSPNLNTEEKIKLEKLLFQEDLLQIFPENIYNWKIFDNAKNLSQGQKQRLNILKAIWKKADLIFLDEPTSGLDKDNQEKYLKLIFDNLLDSTIFLISHNEIINNNFEIIDLKKINIT